MASFFFWQKNKKAHIKEKIIQIFLFCVTRYTVLSDVATDYVNLRTEYLSFFFNGTNFKLSKYKVTISDNVSEYEKFLPASLLYFKSRKGQKFGQKMKFKSIKLYREFHFFLIFGVVRCFVCP